MLNVSHTTVSRSLNDSPLISEETKQRVKALAKKYNYKPNVSARGLVLSKSYNIGLFFTTIKIGTTANFFLNAVRGASGVMKGKYNLAVEAIDDFEDFSQVNAKNFDGILVMSQSPNDNAFIAHVVKEKIPIVVMNREIDGQQVTTVLSDDFEGAYDITAYIIAQGHKEIAIIEGMSAFKSSFKRKNGFLEAHAAAGLSFNKNLAFKGNYDIESGYNAMQKILGLPHIPTAVFCSNDEMALGAMKAIKQQEINMPDEISVAGFDDMGFTAYLTPALTTVLRPVEEMSQEGAEILLQKMENKIEDEDIKINLHNKLVIRDSIKKIS